MTRDHQHRSSRAGKPKGPAPAAAPAKVTPQVAAALALQRGVGNQGATAVLAPAAAAAPAPAPERDSLDEWVENFQAKESAQSAAEPAQKQAAEATPERDPLDVWVGGFQAQEEREAMERGECWEHDPLDLDGEAHQPHKRRRKRKRGRRKPAHARHRRSRTASTPARTRAAAAPAAPAAPAKAAPAAAGPNLNDLDAICKRIHDGLFTKFKGEQVLQDVLTWSAFAPQLEARYQQLFSVALGVDLHKLGEENGARAVDLLRHGRILPGTKVLLALRGNRAHVALEPILAELHAEGKPEAAFAAAMAAHPRIVGNLKGKTLDQALETMWFREDASKSKAIAKHGAMRPVDKIYTAIRAWHTPASADRALLFEGLETCNPATILQEFAAYPGNEFDHDLLKVIQSQLAAFWRSDRDYHRALALIGFEEERLNLVLRNVPSVRGKAVRRKASGKALALVAIELAEGDGATPDFWKAVEEGVKDPAQRKELASYAESAFVREELSKADHARLRAMVGKKEGAEALGMSGGLFGKSLPATVLADPAVARLRQLGGVEDSLLFESPVLKAIKLASLADSRMFQKAYTARTSPFRAYAMHNMSAGEIRQLDVIMNGTLRARINLCLGEGKFQGDDEQFLFQLLRVHATDADRRALGADRALMTRLKDRLSSTEFEQARSLLRPHNETADEAAAYQREMLGRKRHTLLESVTRLGEPITDENRELQTRRRGVAPATEEQRRRAAARRLDAELAVYTRTRDELNAAVEGAVMTVGGLVVTYFNTVFPVGSVLPKFASYVLAAAGLGVVRTGITAGMRGEQFDWNGSDAARAFSVGATEGVMNIFGGRVIEGFTDGFKQLAASAAERATHDMMVVQMAAKVGHVLDTMPARSVMSGGLSGGVVGAVDTLSKEPTWQQGWKHMLEETKHAMGEKSVSGMASGGTLKLPPRYYGKKHRVAREARAKEQ